MDQYAETTVESFDGTSIWYRRIGSGEPTLVLCDGVGCAGYVWRYLIPYFEDRCRLIHWNYRGHGKSETPANLENLGIEECAEDLHCVLDHAGIHTPAVLLGHSMGVQVILEYYHRHPERVGALVPITGSFGKAVDHVHDSGLVKRVFPLLRYLSERFHPMLGKLWREVVRSELGYWYAATFEINEGLIRREDFFPYLEDLSRMNPLVFMRTLASAARHTAEPFLPEVKVPTLIVAGEADRFTPLWISHRMHAMIPDSELLTLPMGSHTGPIELPELTNLRIEKFLDTLDGAGTAKPS
ncbi:MAG: alpha/beta hydrolase [Deltaproteobacteria bacterium]|nr:alpha/beta hydrolase [Deltaproteobacteria bacterium]